QPAMDAGFTAGGHVARLDWLRFNEDKLAQIDENVVALIKKYDPRKRPSTSNIVNTATRDSYIHGCVDIWKINSKVDIAGYSFYTCFCEPFESASNIARIRSTSRAEGKAVWVLETEAGQAFHSEIYKKWGWDEIPKREVSHWQAVAHGAKMILLWKYGRRVTDTQTEHYNLMAWDGSITERALANARISKILQDNAALINDKYYPADVAILASSESMSYHHVNGSGEMWRDAWLGAYKLLWDAHISANYVSNEGILNGELSNYKALLMPHVLNFNVKTAEKIEEFVKNGGVVIADFKLAVVDENSRINFRAPGFGLDKVFGGYINDFLCVTNEEFMCPGGKYNYRKIKLWHDDMRSDIIPHEKAEIIASYKSGKAAILKNRYGKGMTLWFGGNIFGNYRKFNEKSIVPVIMDFLAAAGASSKYVVTPAVPGELIENVEISDLRNKKDDKLIFLINFNNKELKFSLGFKEKIKSKELADIISGNKIKVSGNHCEISIKSCGTLILAEKQ
ncbi:MAG: beta-galactosidase trimerization domain-containing protein, partial [Kiritimatiellia bacterium]|nr:beta-galactosidase trimerization domain-containing protein [Kiritimatiellia bacterium]